VRRTPFIPFLGSSEGQRGGDETMGERKQVRSYRRTKEAKGTDNKRVCSDGHSLKWTGIVRGGDGLFLRKRGEVGEGDWDGVHNAKKIMETSGRRGGHMLTGGCGRGDWREKQDRAGGRGTGAWGKSQQRGLHKALKAEKGPGTGKEILRQRYTSVCG